jgi:hypothetical protein
MVAESSINSPFHSRDSHFTGAKLPKRFPFVSIMIVRVFARLSRHSRFKRVKQRRKVGGPETVDTVVCGELSATHGVDQTVSLIFAALNVWMSKARRCCPENGRSCNGANCCSDSEVCFSSAAIRHRYSAVCASDNTGEHRSANTF